MWGDPKTDARLKKRIIRLVIEEIVVSVSSEPPEITLIVHWKGDKHTRLVVRKNRTGAHRYSTDRGIIEVVSDLARSLPDGQIARVLNRLDYRTGKGNSWTAARVASLRNKHDIPVADRAARAVLLTMD